MRAFLTKKIRILIYPFTLVILALLFQNCVQLSPYNLNSNNTLSGQAPIPTDAERITAATQTANTNLNCAESTLGSFYWEIGDGSGLKVSGTVGATPPTATTAMSIASASKWLYSSYVVQKMGVRTEDVPNLNFTSGRSLFNDSCNSSDTVLSCLQTGNSSVNPNSVNKFFYGSGHMQYHANSTMGLGPLQITPLGGEIQTVLGLSNIFYSQPLLAGGVVTSASTYAVFLRRILNGELTMSTALGAYKVCTNPLTCSSALATPVPTNESWNYSLGHWVEDDPTVGDHAFSSAGAFGFYPWIDSQKKWYGILARRATDGESDAGYHSAQCGRLIRQAWVTGKVVNETVPNPLAK